MPHVKLNGELLKAEKGEKLSNVLIKHDKTHAHPCGGVGSCKKCSLLVDGDLVLSCQYKVEKDITVSMPYDEADSERLNYLPEEHDGCCLVLDLGSTTLALALVSLADGEIIKQHTFLNPQRTFGADVISRIDYCCKNSFEPLQRAVAAAINSMAKEMGVTKTEKMYVAGNTAMLHLLLGFDPACMGAAPYTPAFLAGKEISGAKLNISCAERIITLPNIASFIGADIVAGINLIGLPPEGKHRLLIDLGTNAEIALIGCDKIFCTSAAAGPCFEGGNISCGMGAQKGAIYAYEKGEYKTLGNKKAIGICGTGLIDIIAELLRKNIIDKSGYMCCEKLDIAPSVYLTQEDVRQFQLAKSAIYSAVKLLMQQQGLNADLVEAVYISGGFSNKLNISNAAFCGLIPVELAAKCKPLGNSSLLGTVRYAAEQNDLSAYTAVAEYIDLSTDTDFSQLFIENMTF